MKKKTRWGGRRKNQTGRPPVRELQPGERRRAVWIIATDAEMAEINAIPVDERRTRLLQRARPIISEDALDEYDTASGIVSGV